MSTTENPHNKHTGFTLFPAPPTPPARVNRSHYRSKAISRRQNSIGTLPSLYENSVYHGDEIEEERIREPVPRVLSLLKIKSAPLIPQGTPHESDTSKSSVVSGQQNSLQNSKGRKLKNVTASAGKTRNLRALFPWSSTRNSKQDEPHDRMENKTPSTWRVRKKSFGQLSQMFDVEIGEIDQKKLSTYLGNVLDTSFKTPDLIDVLEPRSDSKHAYQPNFRPLRLRAMKSRQTPAVRLGTIDDGDCTCDPTHVICQCSSSAEFKQFQESCNDHKQEASISSTACLLGIPRARFSSTGPIIETPGTARGPLLSSLPGLSYSSGGSKKTDNSDWSLPESPTAWDDPFMLPPNVLRETRPPMARMVETSNGKEAATSKRASDSQSFSRPFVAGKPPSIICPNREASQQPSSSRASSSSTSCMGSSHHKHVGSRGTISTFDFDFGSQKSVQCSQELKIKQRACYTLEKAVDQTHTQKSLGTHGSEACRTSRWSSCSAQSHSHKRSNSSTCSSLFEVIESANTAIVARAKSAKAVVVMHRRTQNFSTETPPKKSAHWKRIEREQEEQLQKLQKARQQQYLPRNSTRVRASVRRSTYNPASAVRSGEASQQSFNIQQRYSKRVEVRPSVEDEDYRAKTSNGSPVIGREKLTILG